MNSEQRGLGSGLPQFGILGKAAFEWLIWTVLSGYAYVQTTKFDVTLQTYEFGATGWPRVICAAIIIGATAQLAATVGKSMRAGGGGAAALAAGKAELTRRAALQRAAFFLLPFVYLYLVPRVGFYLITPVFVVALMWLMEVRRIKSLISVTAVICVLALLIFTRFFYVALPTGRTEPFLSINNAILQFVRLGM